MTKSTHNALTQTFWRLTFHGIDAILHLISPWKMGIYFIFKICFLFCPRKQSMGNILLYWCHVFCGAGFQEWHAASKTVYGILYSYSIEWFPRSKYRPVCTICLFLYCLQKNTPEMSVLMGGDLGDNGQGKGIYFSLNISFLVQSECFITGMDCSFKTK